MLAEEKLDETDAVVKSFRYLVQITSVPESSVQPVTEMKLNLFETTVLHELQCAE